MTVILMAVIMGLIIVIQAFTPYLVKKTEAFGIYVPEEYTQDPHLSRLKKIYAWQCLVVGAVLTGGYTVWMTVVEAAEGTVAGWGIGLQLALIFFSMVLYFRNHVRVRELKEQQAWEAGKTKKVVADLQFRHDLKIVPGWIFILPIVMTAGLVGYTVLVFDQLPEKIPTHWGLDGAADAFTDKTAFSSIAMLLVLFLMQLLFLFLNQGMRNSGAKIRASRKKQSRERELISRKYGSILLAISSAGITFLFAYLHLLTVFPNLGNPFQSMALISAFVLLTLAATGLYVYKIVKTSHSSEEAPELDVLDADDDKYWKGGLIYINKEDPSMLVEKRFGVGWTINLGNTKTWILIMLPLIAMLVLAFML